MHSEIGMKGWEANKRPETQKGKPHGLRHRRAREQPNTEKRGETTSTREVRHLGRAGGNPARSSR